MAFTRHERCKACGALYRFYDQHSCAVELTESAPSLQAKHFDEGKPPVDLIPWDAMREVARVYGYGETKYGDFNYLKGMPWRRLYGSTLRHLFSWSVGEDLDKESGLPHLAHACCDILMLLTYAVRKLGTDNRAKL